MYGYISSPSSFGLNIILRIYILIKQKKNVNDDDDGGCCVCVLIYEKDGITIFSFFVCVYLYVCTRVCVEFLEIL